jgi:2-oxoglutarate dehydrogenase E1 component
VLRLYVPGETLADTLPRLSDTYTGTIAYEIEHISDHEKRVWLRQAIESGKYRKPLAAQERKELLAHLSRVEAFEQYLRRAFLGQKVFSIEGLDVMVPMLNEAVELAAENGAHEVVIGMAHRGRLNVLAHTLGLGYDSILREFEGERTIEAVVATDEGGTGDVKYHLGAEGTRSTPAGDITVTLAANPSHLEAVDPVVEGRARAEQTDRSTRYGMHDPSVALPVLIHGDASFAGQGGVAETLNLSALEGYSTGGSLHLIANNQVGFTTDPSEGRSTRYSSDLAKGFDIPIIHVNADDPEAAVSAVRLALAFRRRFGHDVVVDLVRYRAFPTLNDPSSALLHPSLRGIDTVCDEIVLIDIPERSLLCAKTWERFA